MAKTRKYEQVTVNGVLWNIHPKMATVDAVKITIGYSHSPVVEKTTDADAAKAELEQLVADGVYTWPQVLSGLYDIVLKQHGKILAEYTDSGDGSKFNLEKAMKAYPEIAAEFTDFVSMTQALREKWTEAVKTGDTTWNANDHQMFPSDVR